MNGNDWKNLLLDINNFYLKLVAWLMYVLGAAGKDEVDDVIGEKQ